MANCGWSEKILQLLRRMNNFYLPGSCRANCLRFEIDGAQVGWIPPNVASLLTRYPAVFRPPHGGAVSLCEGLDSYEKRSEAVDQVLNDLRKEESLTCLKGWRDEKYSVMPKFSDPPSMWMERSATCLFGVKRYGVHVNGYTVSNSGEVSMWLARRSLTKQTYPGLLDNVAAGGLAAGVGIKRTLIKECEEEACIPAAIAEKARPVATVSYTYEDEEGVFAECQFVFDLELPLDFKPVVGDGEVQDFQILPIHESPHVLNALLGRSCLSNDNPQWVDKVHPEMLKALNIIGLSWLSRLFRIVEVKQLLATDDFKPNCAMVVLDFLIRHSFIDPDTEPFYQEFVAGLHQTV